MRIVHVVGARPNFMKAAPVLKALEEKPGVAQMLVHTGQHYDANMSEIFFEQLGLPAPDVNLEVGSGSHAQQTAQIMMRFEELLLGKRPDLVLVYGDVNSTVAAALVCAKLHVPVGHVEAGLRSFDRRMPEEINRLMTDQIADLLFTPSEDGNVNLLREGVAEEKIHLVGNVMIDTLVRLLPAAEDHWGPLAERFGLREGAYGLVTLHRPSNVDEPEQLARVMRALRTIAEDLFLLFPMHPRTRHRLQQLPEDYAHNNLKLVDPLSYLDFLALQRHACLVVTDSGGVQEETTYLGVPCLTLRENTERPVTVTMGTNELVGSDMGRLVRTVRRILESQAKQGRIPPLWDGHAAGRIADLVA